MYIRREVEATIDAMLGQGKVVLVTGARRVGKTTVLKEHLGKCCDYVSMESPRDFALARRDAVLESQGAGSELGRAAPPSLHSPRGFHSNVG